MKHYRSRKKNQASRLSERKLEKKKNLITKFDKEMLIDIATRNYRVHWKELEISF